MHTKLSPSYGLNKVTLHKARLRAVALFALSLISEATVNLQKLALSGLIAAKPDSVCKRFSRLLIWVAAAKVDFAELFLPWMVRCN